MKNAKLYILGLLLMSYGLQASDDDMFGNLFDEPSSHHHMNSDDDNMFGDMFDESDNDMSELPFHGLSDEEIREEFQTKLNTLEKEVNQLYNKVMNLRG